MLLEELSRALAIGLNEKTLDALIGSEYKASVMGEKSPQRTLSHTRRAAGRAVLSASIDIAVHLTSADEREERID